MVNLAEHFFYLHGATERVEARKVNTRSINRTLDGQEILVGVDVDSHRHLLIPVPSDSRDPLLEVQGISIYTRVLESASGRAVKYLNVHCKMPRLDLVFERLLEDLLDRLEQQGGDPIVVAQQALDDWQTLLKTAVRDVSHETVLGLVGELEVLRQMAGAAPERALDGWRGPHNEIHDFDVDGAKVEVKATARVDGDTIHISNLRQLDPMGSKSLHLIAFHLAPDRTAPDLDERIDEVVRLGVPKGRLIKLVEEAGYVYESRPNVDVRYTILKMRTWRVTDSFPGLRLSGIDPVQLDGVVRVNYELQIAALPAAMEPAVAEELLSGFLIN